jgi:hypothetical protein
MILAQLSWERSAALQMWCEVATFSGECRVRPNAQRANELVFLGRPSEAIPEAEEAARLSPEDPSIGVFRWVKGRAYCGGPGRLDRFREE